MFVNLLAPINSLGYGVVGFNILKAMSEAGHSVSLFPINHPLMDDDVRGYTKDIQIIKDTIDNSKFYDETSPSIRIWHQHELDKFVGKGERIGWPIFELDKFTDHELHHLKRVDRLIVCSEWAKTVIVDNNISVPVDVVPLGFDPKIFYIDEAARKARPYYTQDTTVFINVGKWEGRKGHAELVQAFSKAFTPEDDVRLIMMNDNPFIGAAGNKRWRDLYMNSPMGHKIEFKNRMASQDEMRVLFNQVDFGVFPSHAEGWNLEIPELMACGVPSIVTNYSGHTEFCNESNSLLVECPTKVPAHDGIWFHGQGEWGSFNINDLSDKMKYAHQIKQSGEPNGMIMACAETARKLTWADSAKRLVEIL